MNAQKNITSPRLISLRWRFLWFLVGVIGLFTAGMILSVLFSFHSSDVADERLLDVEATQTQGALKNQVQHFLEKMLHGKKVQAVES